MGIPIHRILASQSLTKDRMRNRRKNAKEKDQHKKTTRGNVERKHIKMEKIMRDDWRKEHA